MITHMGPETHMGLSLRMYVCGKCIAVVVRVCRHRLHSSRISCSPITRTWSVTTWSRQATFYSSRARCYSQAAFCQPVPCCRLLSYTALAMYYTTKRPVSCEWTGMTGYDHRVSNGVNELLDWVLCFRAGWFTRNTANLTSCNCEKEHFPTFF